MATQATKGSEPIEFGKQTRELFLFEEGWRNINQGSFGSIPKVIQTKMREYQDRAEAFPDKFIRYEYVPILDESRAATAKLVNAPPETVVLVPNATTGVNTVFKNMVWNPDGKDEIISFSTVYGSCGRIIDSMIDVNVDLVFARTVTLHCPLEDDEIVSLFRKAVEASKAEGKRPRIALYDTVSSMPGLRFPFEKITQVCKEMGILSMIDAAHCVGLLDIDLTKLDPDFFVSNLHKWLHVPRGCAMFYVPLRNQAMIKRTTPTSHGYISERAMGRRNPLPPDTTGKSAWVQNFQFVGTVDNSPYACVKDAIAWREEVLGGEARIREHLQKVAKSGGQKAAEALGTAVCDNKQGTMTNCGMVVVWMPVRVEGDESHLDTSGWTAPVVTMTQEESGPAMQWALRVMMDEYKTFIALFPHNGYWFARLSAQVYLDEEDLEWAGQTLAKIMERIRKGEHLGK